MQMSYEIEPKNFTNITNSSFHFNSLSLEKAKNIPMKMSTYFFKYVAHIFTTTLWTSAHLIKLMTVLSISSIGQNARESVMSSNVPQMQLAKEKSYTLWKTVDPSSVEPAYP